MTRREALDWFLGRVGELGDVTARNRAERSLAAAIDSIWMRRPWTDFTPARPRLAAAAPPPVTARPSS